VADAVLEVVAPDGAGALRDELQRTGEGIRSTRFGVRDLDQAQRYLRALGIDLVEGIAPGVLAVPAERNVGVTFELAEAP
jgi:hypothetical protein